MNADERSSRFPWTPGGPPCPCRRGDFLRGESGLTLLELIIAITISGLVALAVTVSLRIGVRAWEKSQGMVLELRRQANAADLLPAQLGGGVMRMVEVELFNRRQKMPFFFGDEARLVFLSTYSAAQHGRGGMVVADYFAEQQPDRTWKLWLDEQPALDDEGLARWVAGSDTTGEGGEQLRLKPFDTGRAMLLFQGLAECRFEYLRETSATPEWVAPWSLLTNPYVPSAIRLQLAQGASGAARLTPTPVYARLWMGGVAR
jgi:prepilin-type N-terminal cleavage/methylation domain-containing protein